MPEWTGYHVKEDGRAYFRPYIPRDVKHILGAMPSVNLKMKASREAERLALMHYVAIQGLIEDARKQLAEEQAKPAPMALAAYTDDELRALAKQMAQGLNREQFEGIRAQKPRQELLAIHDLLKQVAGDVLAASGSAGLSGLTGLFLRERRIPYVTGDPKFRALVFEFAMALDTETVKPGERRLYHREAVLPPPVPVKVAPLVQQVEPTRLTLGEAIDTYLKRQPDNEYRRKIVRSINLFGEMVGRSLPVTELDQPHVTDFLHDICRLPSDWATKADRGLATVSQMLAENAEKVMAPSTYKDNYVAPLKAFLFESERYYRKRGFPDLSVEKIKYTGNRKSNEGQQRDLTNAELRRLFEGPEFASIAADAGQEALYWLPLIGLYTGARPREICQLNPQHDWGEESGVHFLRVDALSPAGAGVTKSVKTDEVRRIPLHPELVRLGLPEYLAAKRDIGADRLFPSVRVKKGNPYEIAGERFTALLKKTGIYDDNAPPGRKVLGMYVFRKTFITFAGNQGIPTFGITGHKPDHMTDIQWERYRMSPQSLEQMTVDLGRIDYGLVIPLRRAQANT